jgi:predicted Ser/Thr protein kinase
MASGSDKDTPQRLVVRSHDSGHESADTAVAVADSAPTPIAGTPAVSLNDLEGVTLSGRYLVRRKVGQGGMGAVFEATHTEIGGRYAIKVLLDKYAQRDAIVRRLKQEAQLATSLEHEHIIRVTDFGNTDDGRTYVVMEYLEGESLAECIARESKLPEQRILSIAAQTASALAAAHAKGIVHRDIKPENLFLMKRKEKDFVKVVDFGISKSLRASEEQEQEPPRLTQTGMVLGTPLYMSPEQARGDESLDHRVDIYALGVIMYEAATGHVPFSGTNYLSVISQVLNEEPKPLRELRPELSEEFEAIVAHAMTKDRAHRYASANDMLADLNALIDDPTRSTERAKITGPRRRMLQRTKGSKLAYAVGGIGLIVAAVTIAVVWMNSGGGKKPVAAGVLPSVAIDASAVAPSADAAPLQPEAPTILVHIESAPSGASIVGVDDGRDYGTTPADISVVVHDENKKFLAQLTGYDDHPFSFNPVSQQRKNDALRFKMTKAVGRPPNTMKVPKGGGTGSGATPPDHTGGELHPNPYAGSGTLPHTK